MVRTKSLEYSEVFSALLCDVQTLHCDVFTTSDLRKTLNKVNQRINSEGIGFLTKTLPRLGKGFDKVLAGNGTLCAPSLAFEAGSGVSYPKFLGELFSKVLSEDGSVLQHADVACIKAIRQLLFLFYKLELPNDPRLELNVINKFVKTEDEVRTYSTFFDNIAEEISRDGHIAATFNGRYPYKGEWPQWFGDTVREARRSLERLFRDFNSLDIYPRHGPGAVSTKERLEGKYLWTRVCERITDVYPLDAYFYASLGHVCDSVREIIALDRSEAPAQVCLVPKDSRGPRLISCEPVDFQWVQQGLGRAIVRHVESHPLTKESVRFTDQEPNRMAAKYGSLGGRYATLDLNEASDRVSLGLVRLLFPENLYRSLAAARSLGTRLPDKTVLKLYKFAPMGSALCFPVLALTVWSLLYAGLKALGVDSDNINIYVYGDDVIVPTAHAEYAMTILELFGLKINRSKSCFKGLFRESCGMDAYKGVDVTPIKIRSVWTLSPRPESFTSWVAYANSCYERKYFQCYDYIAGWITRTYGALPTKDLGLTAPSLYEVPETTQSRPLRRRWNKDYQKFEYLVLDAVPVSRSRPMNGWSMLLRHFAERCSARELARTYEANPRTSIANLLIRDRDNPYFELDDLAKSDEQSDDFFLTLKKPLSVSEYTEQNRSKLRRCWRG